MQEDSAEHAQRRGALPRHRASLIAVVPPLRRVLAPSFSLPSLLPPPLPVLRCSALPGLPDSDAGGDHPPAKRGRVEPVDLYPPQVYDTRLAPRMKDPRAVLL